MLRAPPSLREARPRRRAPRRPPSADHGAARALRGSFRRQIPLRRRALLDRTRTLLCSRFLRAAGRSTQRPAVLGVVRLKTGDKVYHASPAFAVVTARGRTPIWAGLFHVLFQRVATVTTEPR